MIGNDDLAVLLDATLDGTEVGPQLTDRRSFRVHL